ncbi:signal transduction histidine kinase [Desmospora profundinema]|uniref:histidine kinase n=1 Tax=Desmospora profundinema TaxID=1571184 RepID=A0ABU1II66_9BACL|nr:signal transduction histidine kinase [Desmospora profundinema]
MKLFWRDHFSIVFFFIVQLTLVSILHWADGFDRVDTIGYTFFLSTCLLLVFMWFRYWRYRCVYARLSDPLKSLDESLQKGGGVPLEAAMNELLRSQYQHYQERIHHYEQKQRDHVTFITQWVHQMKTPLSVIQLTLQDRNRLDVKSVREEVDRIKRGLDLVLYTARLDVFDRDFHVESIPLRLLVQGVIHENKRFFI